MYPLYDKYAPTRVSYSALPLLSGAYLLAEYRDVKEGEEEVEIVLVKHKVDVY